MQAKATREHQWLQRFLGEWTYESEVVGVDGRFAGSERFRGLGELWVLGEGEGEFPGGGHGTTLLTIGYDVDRGRYLGTWVGSMMTHLWVYELGELDEARRALTLHAEGPGMTPGTVGRYRDAHEFKSDDHRVLTSTYRDADGTWKPLMTAHYRRRR